ncbi:MAG: NAD(P)/FAD-dependent oxidoreductase [Actinomycetes bacterium]
MPPTPTDAPISDVLVVGAGYAGVHAARAARVFGASVTLLDPTGSHQLATRLAGVAAGAAPVGDGWAPVGVLLPRVRVQANAVTSLVEHDDRVEVLDDAGRLHTARAVVLTAGARPEVPDLPGVAEHTLPLRTVADALRIRQAVERGPANVVVVGGGATGVQVAGEVADTHPDTRVTLLEAGPRLLPDLPRSLGRHARAVLRRRGVDVVLGTGVTRVDEDGAWTGEELRPGLVVWATGFAADATTLLPGAVTSRGRLAVDEHLRVVGRRRVLAAGDVAAHRDVLGRPLPMSAQVATRAGDVAGRNAAGVAADDGRALRTARLVDLGWVITLGGGTGVAQVGPLRLAAPLVDRVVPLLHDAIDVRHLWQVGGLSGVVGHAPGRNEPAPADVRRVERPGLRAMADPDAPTG